MKTFTARASAATELPDIGTFVVVLAEHMEGSGARLEIQLATSFDEQDQALGQDTYCLCKEDGATHYGGVASWTMAQDLLQIRLDAQAERTLGAWSRGILDQRSVRRSSSAGKGSHPRTRHSRARNE